MSRSTVSTAFCMFVGVCSDNVQVAIVLSTTIMYSVTLPISQTSMTFPFVAICKNIDFNVTVYQLPFKVVRYKDNRTIMLSVVLHLFLVIIV